MAGKIGGWGKKEKRSESLVIGASLRVWGDLEPVMRSAGLVATSNAGGGGQVRRLRQWPRRQRLGAKWDRGVRLCGCRMPEHVCQ